MKREQPDATSANSAAGPNTPEPSSLRMRCPFWSSFLPCRQLAVLARGHKGREDTAWYLCIYKFPPDSLLVPQKNFRKRLPGCSAEIRQDSVLASSLPGLGEAPTSFPSPPLRAAQAQVTPWVAAPPPLQGHEASRGAQTTSDSDFLFFFPPNFLSLSSSE